jgi:hypothetical protein
MVFDYMPEHPVISGNRTVIWCPIGREVVSATPKVGSNSVRKAANGGQVPKDKVEHYNEAVVFVRDPLERMESSFHYFNNRASWPQVWHERTQSYVSSPPRDWMDFVDQVLDKRYWDKHWVPQHWLWGPLPTLYYLFEDIEEVFKERYGLRIGHHNKGPLNMEPLCRSYREPELEDFFKDDFKLRADINEFDRKQGYAVKRS